MAGRVVAIDGPAASGKSSTARVVARRLGFAHLDSGALYRGVTLAALEAGLAGPGRSELDPAAILAAAEARGLELRPVELGFAPYLDDRPAEEYIRSAEVTAAVSAVSAVPEVRRWVNAQMHRLVDAGFSVVVDGRDIGSVVFPQAALKVFLTASPGVRAQRRLDQQGQVADPAQLAEETARLAARDRADAGRAVAPLLRAPDALEVDGSQLGFDEQVEWIVAVARERL